MHVTGPTPIPANAEAMLEPGERVLWTGRPHASALFQRGELWAMPFFALWAGAAVFWEVTVLGRDVPLFFKLFGIPIVVVAAYITVGRFLLRRRQLRDTIYVLTDRRAFVVGPGRVLTQPSTFGPSWLQATDGGRRVNVRYDVTVGASRRRPYRSWLLYAGVPTYGLTFEKVEDVEPLLAAIRAAMEGAS